MAHKKTPKYLVIDGCPCPYIVAPQVYMVLRKAGQTASAIYRGSDATAILHAHGKHSQAELYWTSLHGTASQRIAMGLPAGGGGVNPPGESEHELRSDGTANSGPVGRKLAKWQVGVDSGGNDQRSKDAISHAAASFGWFVRHPYARGAEGHHWCFGSPPRPRTLWQRAKIAFYARTLPHH